MKTPSETLKYRKKQELIREAWLEGRLSWKLHKSQQRVYDTIRALPPHVREAVLLISRRWGKSFLITLMGIEDCLRTDGVQIFIVGPEIKHTKRILQPLVHMITEDAPPGLVKFNKTDLTYTIGKSTLVIGAFDTALESFRGLSAQAIYIEETGLASSADYEYIVKSVLRPTLMHSRGKIVHATTMPVEEDHPFIYSTIPAAEANGALFKYTIWDNPLLSEKEILEEIREAGGPDSPNCKRELFCEVSRETNRMLVPEFDETLHVKALEKPSHTQWITGIDFGGVMDPHAVVFCYYDFERNKICFFDELTFPINTPTKELRDAIEAKEKELNIIWTNKTARRVCDAPGQVLVDLRNSGFSCFFPRKGKDSVEDGLQAFRVDVLRNRIEIDPKCKLLIQTLRYGMWDRQRKKFMRTELLGHCDMVAAAVYAFKHTDTYTNPIPGIVYHTNTHYSEPTDQSTNSLASFFYGDE